MWHANMRRSRRLRSRCESARSWWECLPHRTTDVDGFPRQQLRLLQALCDHVAVAVQNARRLQVERAERAALDREADEARAIQQALLPKSSPYIPGFVVSGLKRAGT